MTTLLLTTATFAGDDGLLGKVEQLERQSRALKNSMHKQVVESMSENDRLLMSDKVDVQTQEIKRLHQQMRDQFNNLDPDAQREILLNSSK